MTTLKRIRYDSTGLSNTKFPTIKGPLRIKLFEDGLKCQFVQADHLEVVVQELNAVSKAMLKKKIKKALEELMGVEFKKESRPGRKGKRIGGLPSKPGKLL